VERLLLASSLEVRSRLNIRDCERDEEIDRAVNHMRVYWERIGVLGPIYRLAGKGLNDREIASKLNLAESKVQGCISWMLHSFKMSNRMELAREAVSTEHPGSRHNGKVGQNGS
jgi:hypothetical protein